MLQVVIDWLIAHQVALWAVLFWVSELLGFGAKGGIFAWVYEFLKGKVKPV